MSELTYDEERDLEAAARAMLSDREPRLTSDWIKPLEDVIERIDKRRFDSRTNSLYSHVREAAEREFRKQAQAETEVATFTPTPKQTSSGYGRNQTWEGGHRGWWKDRAYCARAGTVAAPQRVIDADGKTTDKWEFGASCKQHQEKAIEAYAHDLFRRAREAAGIEERFGNGKGSSLADWVTFALSCGADLSYYADELRERGIDIAVAAPA